MKRLEEGQHITLHDGIHQVLGFDGRGWVRLRGPDRSEIIRPADDLVADPAFRFTGEETPPLAPAIAFWDRLDEARRAEALDREEHVLETLTGYRSGRPEAAQPGEPRAAFAGGTQHQRNEAKAAELGITSRQIRRWISAYRKSGNHPAALVSGHATRMAARLGESEKVIASAIMHVAAARRDASDVTLIIIRSLVERELRAMGEGEVTLPSPPTFIKLVKRFAPELTHDAKRRRSDASTGKKRPFGKVVCIRPGQYVQIDITPFDLLARNEVDGREVRCRVVVALDLYSRAVVAIRVMPYEPSGVDVTALILDIIRPVRPHPSWPELPEDARLPYVGIPEGVMLAAHDMPEGAPLLNIPPVLPETLVVDNGMVFLSKGLKELCQNLGINILLARPGTGSDKSHIERFFGTFQNSLAQRLEGYVGNHVPARGRGVKALHFGWELQFEAVQWVARHYNNRLHSSLHHPMVPRGTMTPAEMFAFGVAHAGYLTLPLSRDAYFMALRTELRKIGSTGVRIDGMSYDHPALNPYREQASPYASFGGKWPFKIDPRDPLSIYFQDPNSGEWHAIPSRDADWAARPFHNELAALASEVLAQRPDAAEVKQQEKARLDEMDAAYAVRVKRTLEEARKASEMKLDPRQKAAEARRRAAEEQLEAATGRVPSRPAPEARPPATDLEIIEEIDVDDLFGVMEDDD